MDTINRLGHYYGIQIISKLGSLYELKELDGLPDPQILRTLLGSNYRSIYSSYRNHSMKDPIRRQTTLQNINDSHGTS